MKNIKSSDNVGVTLKLSRRRVNPNLIGCLSMILALLQKDEIIYKANQSLNGNYIVLALSVYAVYAIVISILLKIAYTFIYPSEMVIEKTGIMLKFGALVITMKSNILIAKNPDEEERNTIHSIYYSNEPVVLSIAYKDGYYNAVTEREELEKLK